MATPRKFLLEIDCDAPAFAAFNHPIDDDPDREIARILRRVAENLDGHPSNHDTNIRDSDGNHVGTWHVTGDEI